jgi:hypothetical protein
LSFLHSIAGVSGILGLDESYVIYGRTYSYLQSLRTTQPR